MSYVPLTTDELATGEPVSSSVLNKVKDNFTDHQARIEDLELGIAIPYPPIIFRITGRPSNVTLPATDVLKTTLNFNLTITGVRLLIDTSGITGTTEVDLKFKRGAGSYTSVLTTKPSVPASAGSDAISTNAVLNASYVNLQAGDILSLDILTAQNIGRNFLVRIDYVKS